jgi:molybdenum cofactor synthesis domain-containing protein
MGLKAAVITVSDKGSRGEREDLSGQAIIEILGKIDVEVSEYRVIPDSEEEIKLLLLEFADGHSYDLIITTGGTGVSPRDVTPDATLKVIEKEIPGIAEAMRHASTAVTPHAMISRAVAGIRKRSLIINLPGSPRGVRENLSVVLPALRHAIEKIKGDQSDCAV